MQLPIVRTSDVSLRDLQWSRLREVTAAFLDAQDNVKQLRAAVHATKAALAWEWHFENPDVELSLLLQKRIRSRVLALEASTDNLSSIQSELESLQTVLGDNYEPFDGTR